MKKREVIALLLLLVIFILVGCARKHVAKGANKKQVVKAANSMPSNASKVVCPKFK